VNTGVPHAVVFVDELDTLSVGTLGSAIRYHERFSPRGTNVNFIKQVDADTIAVRTYERGVEGETLACGTGVVASALVFHEITGASSPVHVRVRGGDTMHVEFRGVVGNYTHVTLMGPADFVFEGQVAV
jgi:diaminopimelate epimerase